MKLQRAREEAGKDQAGRRRAHRRTEAAAGFPLLRGCPSTFVLRRLVALEALSAADRLAYADQLSDLAEATGDGTLPVDEREALVARLPLVARVEQAHPARPELRFQPVKSLARLAAEPGGIAAFVRFQQLSGEAATPPAPHVPSFAEAVPAPPAKLKKRIMAEVQARFGGELRKISSDLEQLTAPLPRGRVVLNVDFAGKGWAAMSRQMFYSLWADLDGVRMTPTTYESLWLLPAQWDLVTVANLDRVARHLPLLVEARLALEG